MERYKYKLVIQTVAVFTIFVGIAVIVGWLFNIELLKTILRGYASMKFNTAACFILSGVSLLSVSGNKQNNFLFQTIFPLLVIVIAVVSLSEYIFNYTSVLDQLFVRDVHLQSLDYAPPGRMSKVAAICFIIIAASFLLHKTKNSTVKMMTQWSLHLVTLVSLLAMLAYLYKVPDYNRIAILGSIALHTGILFFSLSIVISLLSPSYGIMGLLMGDKIGNIMARRLFPFVAALLFGITYFRIQVYRQTSMSMEFTSIVFTTFVVSVNLFLIWMTANQLNKIDIKRKTAENSILILNKELEQKVEERTSKLQDTLQQLEYSKQELNEALNKEKELNEMKSRFVSMASHEFKTPLSTILSSASLVSSYTQAADKTNKDKHILRIKNSVKHLNGLLEDFLSLGKLDEKRIKTDAACFNLNEFLHEVTEEIKVGLKPGQSIELTQQGSDEFSTDKRLLKNILLNILGNAVKFSPKETVILLQVNNDGEILKLDIKDNGIGIPKEDHAHLFDSFFRGSNAVNIEGTGLGLHIVKRYLDLLNGTICLESETGKGTLAMITLPCIREKKHTTVIA
jgi:signal transduction histidine kinase